MFSLYSASYVVSIVMINAMNKCTLDKGLIDLTVNCSPSRNLRPETQDSNLEAGTVPEAMEEYCLLTMPCST